CCEIFTHSLHDALPISSPYIEKIEGLRFRRKLVFWIGLNVPIKKVAGGAVSSPLVRTLQGVKNRKNAPFWGFLRLLRGAKTQVRKEYQPSEVQSRPILV